MNSEYAYPINIGNDDEVSINKIASLIITLTNSKSKIIYNELPEDDPLKRKPKRCANLHFLRKEIPQNTFLLKRKPKGWQICISCEKKSQKISRKKRKRR